MKVQIRLKLMTLWGDVSVSVLCGVAIREENHIIVVDVCQSNQPIKIYRRMYGGGGAHVYKGHSHFVRTSSIYSCDEV